VINPQSVAIVGATGAVGMEFLRLFEQRNFPVSNLTLLASERSVGKVLRCDGKEYVVKLADENAFDGIDIAFFSAGAARSRALAGAANAAGALVIDNSSAFRMDPNVPLLVPEVNPNALEAHHRVISVPNCTAIILVVAINALRKLGTFDRLIVSTYQSASGGGAALMRELEDQTRHVLAGTVSDTRNSNLPPYAFNLFSHNTPIAENGYNDEENKVIAETRRILGLPDLKINVTCVRVPVLRAHSESVTVEFTATAPSESSIRDALAQAPGVRLVDDRANNNFPTPAEASGQGDVLVGRIRQDISNPNAISLFIAGDQLLKGAALNAIQSAELALSRFA